MDVNIHGNLCPKPSHESSVRAKIYALQEVAKAGELKPGKVVRWAWLACGLCEPADMAAWNGMTIGELDQDMANAKHLFSKAINLRSIPPLDQRAVPWEFGVPQPGEKVRKWLVAFKSNAAPSQPKVAVTSGAGGTRANYIRN
jgi:hypothetical protein